MDNQELLKKADLALSELGGDGVGGLLNPEQSDTFIRKLIKAPTLVNGNLIRVVPMMTSQRNIDKIGFGKRILRKGTQGTALDTAAVDGAFNAVTEAAARSKPQFTQVQLNTKEVIAEVRIPYDVMEDNIERAQVANNEAMNSGPGGLRTTIISMIAERAALDLEELGLLGDTALGTGDTYLEMLDGWLKHVTEDGNVFDAEGQTISKKIFKEGKKAMPDQYLRNLASLQHFISVDNETEYRDTLADRGTALGDAMVTGQGPAYAYGSPVAAVAMMPEDQGLFTNPKNLIMGIQRQVSMEYDKNIRTREYIIVLTAKVDFQIEEAEATVLYDNIGQ